MKEKENVRIALALIALASLLIAGYTVASGAHVLGIEPGVWCVVMLTTLFISVIGDAKL
jgi:hypothetical protein